MNEHTPPTLAGDRFVLARLNLARFGPARRAEALTDAATARRDHHGDSAACGADRIAPGR